MAKGRLNPTHMGRAAEFIRQDATVFVKVMRKVSGVETLIGQHHVHIAPTDRQITGRDATSVYGQTGPQMNVMILTGKPNISIGDEIWSSEQRYRVVAIDIMPHGKQVMMRQLQ